MGYISDGHAKMGHELALLGQIEKLQDELHQSAIKQHAAEARAVHAEGQVIAVLSRAQVSQTRRKFY